MNTPTDIPADVSATAQRMCDDIPDRTLVATRGFLENFAASAILAERERCAEICDEWAQNCGPYSGIPKDIATQIRDGAQP